MLIHLVSITAHVYEPGECLAGNATDNSNCWISRASHQTVVCKFLYDQRLRDCSLYVEMNDATNYISFLWRDFSLVFFIIAIIDTIEIESVE